MTRRTHACIACADAPGDTPFNRPRRTRHKDQVCALCRSKGIHIQDGQLVGFITIGPDYRGRGE